MCGFFGVINFRDQISEEDCVDISNGIKAIEYRGPDDEGFLSSNNYCFGFKRLSIIDLHAESQPYCTHDKSVVMMCNGEIYNYLELKNTLVSLGYKFKTKTDVEVILHGYIEWGEYFWNKLNGIFSIVVYDRNKNKIYLVRDHLGVKPLHYSVIGEKLYFASDYNSFLSISNYKHSLNKSALLSYLSFRYVIGKQTFYNNISDVLPGTCVVYDENGISENQYWDIPVDTDQDHGFEYYLNELDRLIDESVKKQLVSDVPLGAFISGGLDSSILLSYIIKYKPDVSTYITGFKENGYNEFEHADVVAEYLGLTSPKKLVMNQNEYISSLTEAIKYRGEPLSVPHENAFLKMSRFMKNDITVVMSGEGADELFAGYGRIFRSPHYYYMLKKPLLRKFIDYFPQQGSYRKYAGPMDHFLSRYSWFTDQDKREFLKNDLSNHNYYDEYSLEYIESLFSKVSHLDYYQGLYYIFGKLHLPNLLNRLDRMTMASSVEARVPFLDVKLVEFVSKMPQQYKLRWNNNTAKIKSMFYNSEYISERFDTPKYILKRLAENKIPSSIINRKKMGFPVPLNSWASKQFGEYAYEVLTSSDSRIKGIIDTSIVHKFMNKKTYNAKEDLDGKKIWMLLNIELWLQDKKF